MKIGIIDDDISFSTQLKNKISLYFENTVIDVFNEKFETLNLMEYDYLFIDIMLLQVSGIDLLKKLKINRQRLFLYLRMKR